jgi:hypothetical protein
MLLYAQSAQMTSIAQALLWHGKDDEFEGRGDCEQH